MEKSLSSSSTFFYKYLFLPLWSGGFGFGTIMLFIYHRPERFGFLIGWVFGTLFIYAFTHNLKKVSILQNNLIVSNYIKQVSIPFSNVSTISENRLLNTHPISIHLKSPSVFGSCIVFMPAFKFYVPFCSHPIYKELKNSIQNAIINP